MKDSNISFPINWERSPSQVIQTIIDYAKIIETECTNGSMIWHCWNGDQNKLPLVLLHGGWGSWTHWLRVIPELACLSPILAGDLPGMGASADFSQRGHTIEMSELVAEAIDQLVPLGSQFNLVCFSFGAIVGAEVAALHGNRCENFIAVGAAGFGDLHHIVTGITVPDPTLESLKLNIIHKNNLKLLMIANEALIDDLAIYIHRRNIECGRFKSRRLSKGRGFIDALPKIKARIGGIWGELDSTGGGIALIKKRKEIIQYFHPQCMFEIIKGGGHWVMHEKPKEFVASLLRQLNEF